MQTKWLERAPYFFASGAMALSFLALKKIFDTPDLKNNQVESLSYEMPRMKSQPKDIDLRGRKLVVKYKGFESSENNGKVVPPLPGKNQIKNIDPKKAKADEKKNAKKDVKDKNEKKVAKKDSDKKETQSSPSNQDSLYGQKLKESDSLSKTANHVGNSFPQSIPGSQVAGGVDLVVANTEKEKNKISYEQWKTLLFSEPTTENKAKILAALKAHEIDEVSFVRLAKELYNEGAGSTLNEKQKLGLDLLKAQFSAKAFVALLSLIQESTPEEVQKEITNGLKAYAEVSKFGILNQLLYASDARVVSTAQSLIGEALSALENRQIASSREGRGLGFGTASVVFSQFKSFLPGLKRLTAANNDNIAKKATELMETIQHLSS